MTDFIVDVTVVGRFPLLPLLLEAPGEHFGNDRVRRVEEVPSTIVRRYSGQPFAGGSSADERCAKRRTDEATNDDDTGARLTSSILRSGDRPRAASMATLAGETPARTSRSETIRVSGAVKVGMSVLVKVSKRGSP